MSVWDKVHALLRDHGAQIVRTKKHVVWRFPDGRIWVHASTPSDVKAGENNYRDLRRFLGLNGSTKTGDYGEAGRRPVKESARTGVRLSRSSITQRKKFLTNFEPANTMGSRTIQEQLRCKIQSTS